MWKRVTPNKLCNLNTADYIIVHEWNDKQCEVRLGYKQREFAISNILTYEEAQKFIDVLQTDLGGNLCG